MDEAHLVGVILGAYNAFSLANGQAGAAVPTRFEDGQLSCGERGWKRGHWLVLKPVFLSLGSNVGDRQKNLLTALDRVKELGEMVAISSVYETEPVGFTAQPWFLNCVARISTEKMPKQLLQSILAIERSMGRQRQQKKGPRAIDIDILLFGNSVISAAGLTVPHPSMHERRFVLEPLAEIDANVRHPIFKRTVKDLLNDLPPGQAVRRLLSSR